MWMKEVRFGSQGQCCDLLNGRWQRSKVAHTLPPTQFLLLIKIQIIQANVQV
jgi:hypothetical protein